MAASMVDSVLAGLSAHLYGAAIVLSRPALFRQCIPAAGLAVASAIVIAVGIWLPCLLLRHPLISWTVTLESLMFPSSLVVTWSAQQLRPTRYGSVFFGALAACSEPDARMLQGLPVIRGITAHLRSFLSNAVLTVGMIAVFASTAPVWLPLVFGSLAAVVTVLPLLILPVGAGLFVLAWLLISIAPAYAAFSRIGQLSVTTAVLLIVGWLCGLVPTSGVEMLGEVCWAYLLSITCSQQLLSQLAVRMNSRQWDEWCAAHRSSLAGFGLPAWALMRFVHPLLGLLLLEVQQGAAGAYLSGKLQVLEHEA